MADPKTRAEVIQISNAAADAAGIPRLLLLACGIAEGNLVWNARRPRNPSQDATFWPDVSPGVWQQTIRWSAEHLKAASKAGRDPNVFPGAGTVAAISEAYLDVEYAAEVAAQQLKAKWNGQATDDGFLRAMYLYNWPAGGGRPYTPEHEQNYRRGLAEAKTILGGAPMPPTGLRYNPDAPVDLQPDDWSCSEQSAQWMLRAIGRDPQDAWIRGQLLDNGLVTREYGLMDSTGTALAAWLQREYGDEMGLRFTAYNNVSWEALADLAGKQPVILGGRGWNHWTGVRRIEGNVIRLANPAPTWRNVGNELDRDEFDRFGSWSLITVDEKDAVPAPGPTPADPRDRQIKELATRIGYLEADNATLRKDLDDARTKLGVASVDYAEGLQNLVNAYRALKPPA